MNKVIVKDLHSKENTLSEVVWKSKSDLKEVIQKPSKQKRSYRGNLKEVTDFTEGTSEVEDRTWHIKYKHSSIVVQLAWHINIKKTKWKPYTGEWRKALSW